MTALLRLRLPLATDESGSVRGRWRQGLSPLAGRAQRGDRLGWSGRVNFIDPRLVTVADLTPRGEIAASSSQATNRTKTNVDHIGMANNDQTAITTPK
jgi:hypothetical protein